MINEIKKAHHYPEVGVPFLWPFALSVGMEEQALAFEQKSLKFLEEIDKIEIEKPKPQWTNQNKTLYSLHTFTLRDFSHQKKDNEVPVFILPPYSGHASVIADFHKHQSLVETLLKNGIKRIFVTDWHSATLNMKDYDIDNYLEEIHVAIDDLGGHVHLIGLCQGGWMASLYAARFPEHVKSLVLAGSPIDTQAGNGVIKAAAHKLPLSFFEDLVYSGGGLLKGTYMLEGFKSMHPKRQYVDKYIELYEHSDDPDYIKRVEDFERWYEYTIDLPGRWYLQVIKDLFKENLFVKGKFVGLGKTLNPKDITCPLYLLAGESDDITPQEQLFNAGEYFGTPEKLIIKDVAKGGHIGLFMGLTPLTSNWLKIVAWLLKQNAHT